MKKFFRIIHLYLGLAAGIVIMISCLTGAILVFEEELMHAFNHNRYYVKAEGSQLSLDKLITNVKLQVPEGKLVSAKVYADELRSIEIGINISDKEKEMGNGRSEEKKNDGHNHKEGMEKKGGSANGLRASHTVFVNQYTGKILEVYNYKNTFFYQVFALHRWLLGSPNGIGKVITGISVCIFFFILLTGIFLWWPKSANVLKHRLKIKTNGTFKRLNHDLHIILGFYTSIFLFIIIISAISLAHDWFNDGMYKITSSSKELPEAPKSKIILGKGSISFNDVLRSAKQNITDTEYYNIRKPKDSVAVFTVNVLPKSSMEMATATYYIDQYNAKVIGSLSFADKNTGQQIRSSMKSIHTGSFFGMPSKILWLVVSLLGFTSPITGTIMWLKRIKKKKSKVGTKYATTPIIQ
ncbi:MAG: hypothetical protein JWN56_421 [Sphingobacteriales bacterium]|nr:hypothetical protein [Sphingobacteriales bacterium]